MTRSTVYALLALIAVSSAARAESADARAACEPDVWRLCASYIPNAGAITSCLRSRRTELNPACRTVMDNAGGTPGRRRSTRSAEAR